MISPERLKELKSDVDNFSMLAHTPGKFHPIYPITLATMLELIEQLERANVLVEALDGIRKETGVDDPNFGNFTHLGLAARLGLIDLSAREALKKWRGMIQFRSEYWGNGWQTYEGGEKSLDDAARDIAENHWSDDPRDPGEFEMTFDMRIVSETGDIVKQEKHRVTAEVGIKFCTEEIKP